MKTRCALFLSMLVWTVVPVWCQTTAGEQAVPGIKVSDATLIDQNGNKVRFSDLLKDKIVVINTVFTSCPTICPVMGSHFASLTKLLGTRAGADVSLISISVDPVKDTPDRLKAWSDKFHPGKGWTLLTGERAQVETVLRGLRLFAIGAENHSPTTLIGDARTGEWRRSTGLQSAERIAALIPPAQKPVQPVRAGTKAAAR